MKGILGDRYFLLGIATALIVVMVIFTHGGENTEEDGNTAGMVYGVERTEKGYMFIFEDSAGGRMRCFSYDEPENNEPYTIRGRLSDDGEMFFVSAMDKLSE